MGKDYRFQVAVGALLEAVIHPPVISNHQLTKHGSGGCPGEPCPSAPCPVFSIPIPTETDDGVSFYNGSFARVSFFFALAKTLRRS